MIITHAKVSGLTNPADPDLVGGEDWDDDHVINGSALVNVCSIVLTTGGAIWAQQFGEFSFSKQSTGTYRAIYVASTWGGADPMVIATISTLSGVPKFTRVQFGGDETDFWVDVSTIDASGEPVDLASGTLTIAVFAITS